MGNVSNVWSLLHPRCRTTALCEEVIIKKNPLQRQWVFLYYKIYFYKFPYFSSSFSNAFILFLSAYFNTKGFFLHEAEQFYQ